MLSFFSCGDKERTKHRHATNDPASIVSNDTIIIPNIIHPNPNELKNLILIEDHLPKGFSRKGDVDYTETIQKVLNEYRNVKFPDFPLLVNYLGLKVKSNSKLVFQKNSLIKLNSTDKIAYEIIKIENVQNVSIFGLKVEGDRYRRIDPDNKHGEWGMGLMIKSSENIKVYNPTITKCWGDGIYIGRGDVEKPNNDVLIYQAIIDDNRRNGISIICGRDIEIIEPLVSNTKGTSPESGIDIEPNGPDDVIDNILIKDAYTYNNEYIGIVVSLSQMVSDKAKEATITILNHTDKYSENGFMIASFRSERKASDVRIAGKILVKNSKWMFNERPYVIGVTRILSPLIEIVDAKIYSDENNPGVINEKMLSNMNQNNEEVVFRSNKGL
tara:strand:+ start:521 stop:1675 length:1155 start_codon:yes stop_codon:yes gene_type:complete